MLTIPKGFRQPGGQLSLYNTFTAFRGVFYLAIAVAMLVWFPLVLPTHTPHTFSCTLSTPIMQDGANIELSVAAPTPINNKVSELLYQLATGHAGLLLSYCLDVSLPFRLTTLTSLSLCVQLLAWTDTLGPDDAARIAREQLREVLAGCLGLIHLFIFIYFVPMPAYLRSLAVFAVCCVCIAAALPSLPGDAKGQVVCRRTRQSRIDSWAPAKRLCGWFWFWSKNKGEGSAMASYEELRETWRAGPTNQ